jgi:CRP-like cAMP-binding protein
MTRPAERERGLSAAVSDTSNPLIRKLSHFAPLSDSDRQVLDALAAHDEFFPADVDIVSEGSVPRSVFLLKEGMAIRYRNLPDGGRQIMTFLIPGDLCDIHVFLLKAMDHSIGTVTPVRVAPISRESMMDLFSHRPRISAALWWSSLQEEAMLRERIVSLGRRDARGRIAYLLCELLWRHAAVGLTNGDRFRLPLTQAELGDTLGLTPVHVNRVLKEFRQRGLIAMEHRVINLLDVQGLQDRAAFNKAYLHLGGASSEVARYFDRLEDKQRGGSQIRSPADQ